MVILNVTRKDQDGEVKIEVSEIDGVLPWSASESFAVVGKSAPRLEGHDKVTGRARYSYDIRLPGQLYARVLRSPYPHARILAIDTSKAEQLEGVHAILTAANAPEIPWYEKSFIFDRTVRFIGDEVAAVAAESEEIADDALGLIEVTYEQLPHVTDFERALDADAPRIWPEGNNAGEPKKYTRGDPDAGFLQADITIEGLYHTEVALHNSLEPHGCTALWEGDRLTLWSSTQSVFTVRQEIAEALGLPEHRVRVIKEHMGGGFGAKQISWKHDVIASLLSRESGKPVQLMLDRRAENLAVGNRNGTTQRVRLGALRDGTLTAISADILQGRGAYATGGEASDVSGMYKSLYRCANVATRATSVHINTGPAVAFRAPGHVEAAFALEQAMDELAIALAIDPVELRRRNYAQSEQIEEKPYTLPNGLELCYDRVTEAVGWSAQTKQISDGSKRRGVGFAAHDWVAGSGHPPGYVWIELLSDGTANIVTGTQDIGTGTRTGLAQIAAEELGLPLDSITLRLGDTGAGPYAPVSSGSATQATMGPAIRSAGQEVRRQFLEVAAVTLNVPIERLQVRDGSVWMTDKSDPVTSVAEIMQKIAPHTLQAKGARSPNPANHAVRTFGAQFAEIEVDTETGEITVLRIVTAHDVGRIVNPKIIDSQVVGGVIQGVGFGLTEERILDHRLGRVMNPNLEEYKVPTVADIPRVKHLHIDVADTLANSTGAKGVGEPPLIPTAPAIANAFFNATGVRLRSNPMNRARVLAALESAKSGSLS